MLKLLALICLLTSCAGCSSGTVSASAHDNSLVAIDQAVYSALSMGIEGQSENGRELTSRPFQVSQEPEALKSGYRERGVAHVTILGDGRPYTIESQVSIEWGKINKDPDRIFYKHHHYDKGLARKLLNDILAGVKRHGQKNVIDDYSPF